MTGAFLSIIAINAFDSPRFQTLLGILEAGLWVFIAVGVVMMARTYLRTYLPRVRDVLDRVMKERRLDDDPGEPP